MEIKNPRYQNQGIHVIASIFTVEKGVTKVLLIRRKKEPYKDTWALVGGALYNDEELLSGINREIYEKVGIRDIDLKLCNVFSEIDRSPVMRMLAVTYLGVIDSGRVEILKDTLKTSDADWFPIDRIPDLAYDHNHILQDSLENLKISIGNSTILKTLFPQGFTIPEIQKTYESILGKTFDRRNFRRKLLNSGLIVDTNKEVKFEGKKPAKVYQFKEKIENENVF